VGRDDSGAPGEGVEEAGLAGVGQSDDAETFRNGPRGYRPVVRPLPCSAMSKRTKKAKARIRRKKANHGTKPNRGRG